MNQAALGSRRRLRPRNSPSLIVFGRLATTFSSLLSAPVVARSLGAEGRGETAAAIAMYFIVPVVIGLGIPLEVRRLSAVGAAPHVVRAARDLCVVSCLPVAAIAVASYASIFASFEQPARVIASLGVALAPVAFWWACDLSVLIAQQRYVAVFAMQIVHPLVFVPSVVVLWLTEAASTSTVLLANSVGTVITAAVGSAMTRVSFRGPRYPRVKLLRRGSRFAGSAISEMASNKLDQVIALPLLGAHAAGVYSVAVTVAGAPLALGHALGAASFPHIAQTEGAARKKAQALSVRQALAAGIVTAPVVAVASWAVVPFLFGKEFDDSVKVIFVCLIGTVAMLGAFVASMALAAGDQGLRMSFAQGAALLMSTVLLVVLGPPFGALGAAAASSAGYLTLLMMLLLALRVRWSMLAPRPGDVMSSIKLLVRSR